MEKKGKIRLLIESMDLKKIKKRIIDRTMCPLPETKQKLEIPLTQEQENFIREIFESMISISKQDKDYIRYIGIKISLVINDFKEEKIVLEIEDWLDKPFSDTKVEDILDVLDGKATKEDISRGGICP